MNELLAYIMGMGRCFVCGGHVSGTDAAIISDDSDNAVVWHAECAPISRIERIHTQCRMMAAWN